MVQLMLHHNVVLVPLTWKRDQYISCCPHPAAKANEATDAGTGTFAVQIWEILGVKMRKVFVQKHLPVTQELPAGATGPTLPQGTSCWTVFRKARGRASSLSCLSLEEARSPLVGNGL